MLVVATVRFLVYPMIIHINKGSSKFEFWFVAFEISKQANQLYQLHSQSTLVRHISHRRVSMSWETTNFRESYSNSRWHQWNKKKERKITEVSAIEHCLCSSLIVKINWRTEVKQEQSQIEWIICRIFSCASVLNFQYFTVYRKCSKMRKSFRR